MGREQSKALIPFVRPSVCPSYDDEGEEDVREKHGAQQQ
jgi:hypothetical protein